jgi:hypothetical protein
MIEVSFFYFFSEFKLSSDFLDLDLTEFFKLGLF